MIPNHICLKMNVVMGFNRGVTYQVDVLDEKNAEKIFNIDLIKEIKLKKNILTGDLKSNICNLRGYEYCF